MNKIFKKLILLIALPLSLLSYGQSLSSPQYLDNISIENIQIGSKNKSLRVALPRIDNYSKISRHRNEILSNFLHEYWQIWAIDNRHEITFVYLDHKDMQQALIDNDVDVVGVRATESGYDNNLLSIPYAKYTRKIFRRHKTKHVDAIRIAIHAKKSTSLSFLNANFIRTYFDDIDVLLAEQSNFDALYSTSPELLEEKLNEERLHNAFFIAKEDTPEIYFHFATRKSDRNLLYMINENIKRISRLQAQLWTNKYILYDDNILLTFGNYLTNMSESEKQFIIDNNLLRYPVTEGGTAPYIITDASENVDVRGISVDITKIATEKTGIIFKPLFVTDLDASTLAITEKKADLSITASKKPATKKLLSYSIPYVNDYYNLTKHSDLVLNIDTFDINRLTIAIVKGLPATQILKDNFPHIRTKLFPSISSALVAVQKKQADIYIGSPLITDYLIESMQLSQLNSTPYIDFQQMHALNFSTLTKNKNLITLLNKTLNSITSLQFNDMFTKWHKSTYTEINSKQQVATAYRNMSLILAAIIIICLVVFWVYYRKLQTRKLAQIQIEKELTTAEEARFDAEQSAQAKVAFLARMSHEIRTPMNGVLGMAEALAFTQLNGKQKDLLDTLNGSARNLLALLNNVLDFSKLDAGKLTLESVPIDLAELSKNIVNGFKHIYSESEQEINDNISIELLIDDYIKHSYYGDPTRLTQVLNNLLSNAVKFTERGTVTVEINIESIQTIRSKVYDTISFSVTDTGIGIAPEQQELLFTPFIQADSAITRKYGGTGLGLSICQEIINAMDGEIQIKSSLNQGSCFYFQLKFQRVPIKQSIADQKIQSARKIQEPDIDFSKVRVLVAEDNLVNVLVITAQLERLHITPDIAENGKEALDKHREHPYDIIISDCHMPIMDGFELASIISKEKAVRPVWIIAITAEALSGAAEKCFKAGFDDFIAKPCPQEEITNKLCHAYKKINEID